MHDVNAAEGRSALPPAVEVPAGLFESGDDHVCARCPVEGCE
jgi:hypothetical protein